MLKKMLNRNIRNQWVYIAVEQGDVLSDIVNGVLTLIDDSVPPWLRIPFVCFSCLCVPLGLFQIVRRSQVITMCVRASPPPLLSVNALTTASRSTGTGRFATARGPTFALTRPHWT